VETPFSYRVFFNFIFISFYGMSLYGTSLLTNALVSYKTSSKLLLLGFMRLILFVSAVSRTYELSCIKKIPLLYCSEYELCS